MGCLHLSLTEHTCNLQVAFWGTGARMRGTGQGQMVLMESLNVTVFPADTRMGFNVTVFPADGRMGFLRLGV